MLSSDRMVKNLQQVCFFRLTDRGRAIRYEWKKRFHSPLGITSNYVTKNLWMEIKLMLSQIVRPLVRTQLRLLASTQATRSTLIATMAQWLGYLGVQAQVTKLSALSGQIHVALTVGKPDACDPKDWQQILQNLQESEHTDPLHKLQYAEMTPKQQTQLQRLLAHLIQVGATTNNHVNWDILYPQLQALVLDEELLLGIKSALKVPQPLDRLLEGLDPKIAELALHYAVSIALLDQHVTPQEDSTLTALLKVIES